MGLIKVLKHKFAKKRSGYPRFVVRYGGLMKMSSWRNCPKMPLFRQYQVIASLPGNAEQLFSHFQTMPYMVLKSIPGHRWSQRRFAWKTTKKSHGHI